MTWSEFSEQLRRIGVAMSAYHVRRSLAVDPPAKVNGARQYEQRHAVLAEEYARGRGWIG